MAGTKNATAMVALSVDSKAAIAAGTIAAGLGLLLPWWIARTGRDPAFGSGPAATVIQDVVSLLVYFAVVRAFGI